VGCDRPGRRHAPAIFIFDAVTEGDVVDNSLDVLHLGVDEAAGVGFETGERARDVDRGTSSVRLLEKKWGGSHGGVLKSGADPRGELAFVDLARGEAPHGLDGFVAIGQVVNGIGPPATVAIDDSRRASYATRLLPSSSGWLLQRRAHSTGSLIGEVGVELMPAVCSGGGVEGGVGRCKSAESASTSAGTSRTASAMRR